ncbi:MAG: RNA polymerase factor sigma-54 [Candidatus Marinimicrobia bacterium]|nr:RNA polymerase factor sigma-54 [Candidatus Neomarinimicrobiota bacterium]
MSKLQQKLELGQKLTPQQVLQANILQLNTTLLEQRILQELEENPALEMAELEDKPVEDENQDKEAKDENELEDDEPIRELDDKKDETDFEWEELMGDPDEFDYSSLGKPEKQEYFEAPIKAQISLSENLTEQLNDLNLTDFQFKIADELIGNIDESGYLTIETILVADRMGIDEREVLEVLNIILTLEPLGIGARNLRECLLAQVADISDTLTYQVLDEYFDDFANRRYQKIIDSVDCTEEELKNVMEEVSQLSPNPGDSLNESMKEIVLPDISCYFENGEWVISINDSTLPEIRITDNYFDILEEYKDRTEVRKFVKEKLDSAKWFIEAINQRRDTMRIVMASIIHKQPNFFNSDKRELSPMILKDIAEDLNLDISTISRVTNGKYVQLSFGIYELKEFFSEGIKNNKGEMISNTVVKNRLKELIQEEDKSSPLGDEELALKLQNDGYQVARRTVSKYREQLKLPVSRLRKTL